MAKPIDGTTPGGKKPGTNMGGSVGAKPMWRQPGAPKFSTPGVDTSNFEDRRPPAGPLRAGGKAKAGSRRTPRVPD